ncbi:MAG: 50S ribosomal protein L6 [Phycisphaeraceae bacterium]|nr:50S ribosomal protein L6 [Phycisphaeraceae bacterium]
MSRIGKQPVPVPAGVKVSVNAGSRTVDVQGPKGKLSFVHRPEVKVASGTSEVTCTVDPSQLEVGNTRAYWGLTRALVATAIEGVTKGFTEKLEVIGVGWGAKVQGKKITLTVGYADPVELAIPDGVTVAVNGQIVEISGPDKQKVGQLAAYIRMQRKPEPYNGKGIKYVDEVIQRKKGKAFGA